jgi:histone deacetylase 1/2
MEAINSSTGVVVPSHSGFMSIKLDRTNYPLWLAQIVPILKSKNLMGFVTGTNPCPPEFKSNTDGTITTEVDPRYATWHQQDQMILSWINNSLSPTVLSTVARFTSSQATWSSLEKRYASQSKNRILQLRHDLLTVKGEGLSISDFVDKINQIADNLALAGKPVDDDELVNIILNNVGPAYEVTVSSAQARDTSISYDDLVALLLNAEMRLKAQQTPSLETSPTAMYAPKATHNNNRGRNSVHHRGSNMRGRGPSGFRRYQNWSQPQSGSVSFGNSGPMPSRPPCQICNRSGHSALDCYQRMNHAYEGRIPTQKLTAMAAIASSNIPSSTWISDSGASNHITSDLTNLAIHNEYQGKDHVAVGNGAGLTIAHTGSSKFTCGSSTFALKNILHCPSIAANLLSIYQFTRDNNCYFVFYSDCFYVKDVKTGKTLFHGKSEHGLYPFRIHTQISTKSGRPFALVGVRVSVPIWHSRLGHPANNTLSHLISNKCLLMHGNNSLPFCNSCPLGKSTKLPFQLSDSTSKFPLELIHSDVWTSPIISIKGSKYYILFVDDFSRYSWIFPMQYKHEVFDIFLKFKLHVENLFSSKIKMFQSDGGSEYTNRKFQNYLAHNGIGFRSSCPGHPEQNGVAERKHRHIVDTGLTLLAHAHMSSNYWVDAFQTALYLINRLPTRVLQYLSPYEKLFHKSPSYDTLRVFGCACFPYLRPYNTNKLQFRSKRCVFLGYSLNHQGYRCLDQSTGRIYLSRHVIFDELSFPFQETINTLSAETASLDFHSPLETVTEPLPHIPLAFTTSPDPPTQNPPNVPITSITPSTNILITPPIITEPTQPNTTIPNPIITETSSPTTNPHPMVTRSRAGVSKPNPKYALTVTYDPTLLEPTCYTQAAKSEEWRKAMGAEFNALQQSGTWSLVQPTSDMNILPNKWVFKIKKHSDGTIERYKARLVANGFHQQEGIDYTETFSPVVKHSTIRIILALAVNHKWPIRQLDVQNAFLHGILSEEVYMRQPSGFIDPNYPNHVCKLHKSLYGLKQAPRQWFTRFSDYLEELGFCESKADYSLFTFQKGDLLIILLIYVDDILITGTSSSYIFSLIQNLGRLFSMKDLGPLHYFLGLEAVYSTTGLHLTQTKYTMDLLFRTKFQDVKPISSPANAGKKLSLYDGDPLSDPTEFRSVVGALQYLTLTRPDICFAVNQVCQFLHQPTTHHWTAVKRILRYLKDTPDHGLFYQPGSLLLEAYSDADYAGCPDDRHSTGGYCVYLGHNPISWSAKKQRTVSRSSTEAEYRQLAYTAAELSWIRSLFKDLGIRLSTPRIWCDNISSISLASNPVFHARTKHLEVDYHYVRDKVVRKELEVCYLSTTDQVADIFTKGLSKSRFLLLTNKLMVRSRPISLRGCDNHGKPEFKSNSNITTYDSQSDMIST